MQQLVTYVLGTECEEAMRTLYRHASFMCLLQTFIKVANYQHIMPTRYTLEVDLKNLVTNEALDNSTKRTEARKVQHVPAVQAHRPAAHQHCQGQMLLLCMSIFKQ